MLYKGMKPSKNDNREMDFVHVLFLIWRKAIMDLATIIFIVNVGSQLEYFKDMTQPVIIIFFYY